MKRTIIIIVAVLVIQFCIFEALADPGDFIFTLRVPASKVNEFKTAYIAENPVQLQLVSDANGVFELEPVCSDAVWIKRDIKKYIFEQYRQGKEKLAKQSAVIDPNIIE